MCVMYITRGVFATTTIGMICNSDGGFDWAIVMDDVKYNN